MATEKVACRKSNWMVMVRVSKGGYTYGCYLSDRQGNWVKEAKKSHWDWNRKSENQSGRPQILIPVQNDFLLQNEPI